MYADTVAKLIIIHLLSVHFPLYILRIPHAGITLADQHGWMAFEQHGL